MRRDWCCGSLKHVADGLQPTFVLVSAAQMPTGLLLLSSPVSFSILLMSVELLQAVLRFRLAIHSEG
jgi:membrane glycosyltransferase